EGRREERGRGEVHHQIVRVRRQGQVGQGQREGDDQVGRQGPRRQRQGRREQVGRQGHGAHLRREDPGGGGEDQQAQEVLAQLREGQGPRGRRVRDQALPRPHHLLRGVRGQVEAQRRGRPETGRQRPQGADRGGQQGGRPARGRVLPQEGGQGRRQV